MNLNFGFYITRLLCKNIIFHFYYHFAIIRRVINEHFQLFLS